MCVFNLKPSFNDFSRDLAAAAALLQRSGALVPFKGVLHAPWHL